MRFVKMISIFFKWEIPREIPNFGQVKIKKIDLENPEKFGKIRIMKV